MLKHSPSRAVLYGIIYAVLEQDKTGQFEIVARDARTKARRGVLRNSKFKDHVVYWAQWVALRDSTSSQTRRTKSCRQEIERLMKVAFRHMVTYRGEVPGATAVNCGNYLLHDLPMAKYEALRFLKQEWRFDYPKARRIKAGDRIFFDA